MLFASVERTELTESSERPTTNFHNQERYTRARSFEVRPHPKAE